MIAVKLKDFVNCDCEHISVDSTYINASLLDIIPVSIALFKRSKKIFCICCSI